MLKLRIFWVTALLWLVCLTPHIAGAQTLTTFTSEASYTAALPSAGVTTTVEGFTSITAVRPVPTVTPEQWNGFTLIAQGTSDFGSSTYCVSLRTCLNWTPSPPTLPGIYTAVADPAFGNGRVTFAPAARAFGFGLEYWDWNDGSQRSQIVVTLSNGAVFNVTGPTTVSGAAGGFIGFRIDQTSVNAGITIASVAWVALPSNSEIIGIRNVRVSVSNPLVVTNTNDSGAGSLRAAIQFANAQSGASTISFAIPGAGPHTITLSSILPNLTANGLTIDGTTQSGTQCRDLWAGNGHDLRVNVRGGGFNGFQLGAANQTIRGLSLTGFDNAVFTVAGSSNATIQCNYLGLLANGTSSANARGVLVRGASARIGGLNAGQGNVISANVVAGVVTEAGSTDTAIRGNFIGTDPAGMAARANGVAINNFMGTATWRDITRNLISGNNGGAGIMLETDDRIGPSDGQIRIQSNIIGFNRTSSAQLLNAGDGIRFSSDSITTVLIGGAGSSEGNEITGALNGIAIANASDVTIQGNVIASASQSGVNVNSNGSNIRLIGNTIRDNSRNGIQLENATRAALLGNRIFANGLLGIDLGNNGVTANDAGDGDAGANDLLNFPQINRAIVSAPTQLTYRVTLDAPAAANGYRIEFFANSVADPNGFGEGERYLGHVDVNHAGGVQSYTGTLATLQPVAIGDIISATTSRRTAGGSWDISSEFSAVATADGVAALTVAISSEVFVPPADNPFATPGNDILLTTTVSNAGTGSTDADSIFVAIRLDPAHAFYNAVTPALGGIVGFQSGTPGLTLTPTTDLRFSDSAAAPASFAQCTYTPAAGYDPQVRHVCLNPKGTLPGGGPAGQFVVQLRSQIE